MVPRDNGLNMIYSMPKTTPTTFFTLHSSQHAIVTIVLIENSRNLATVWSSLRNEHLRPFLDHLGRRNARQAGPILFYVWETAPERPGSGPRLLHSGGVCDDLDNLSFNYECNNRVSSSKILAAINALSSDQYNRSRVARHLVILAASTPINDPKNGGIESSWDALPRWLTEADIQLHLLLYPAENLSLFTRLFDKTLMSQKSIEVAWPGPSKDQSQFILRYSEKSEDRYPERIDTSANVSNITDAVFPEAFPFFQRLREELGFEPPIKEESPELEDSGTWPELGDGHHKLVDKLQMMHGLHKKRIYSRDTRTPFISEQPFNPEALKRYSLHKSAPDPPPFPTNHGSRTVNVSTTQRSNRMRLSQTSPIARRHFNAGGTPNTSSLYRTRSYPPPLHSFSSPSHASSSVHRGDYVYTQPTQSGGYTSLPSSPNEYSSSSSSGCSSDSSISTSRIVSHDYTNDHNSLRNLAPSYISTNNAHLSGSYYHAPHSAPPAVHQVASFQPLDLNYTYPQSPTHNVPASVVSYNRATGPPHPHLGQNVSQFSPLGVPLQHGPSQTPINSLQTAINNLRQQPYVLQAGDPLRDRMVTEGAPTPYTYESHRQAALINPTIPNRMNMNAAASIDAPSESYYPPGPHACSASSGSYGQ